MNGGYPNAIQGRGPLAGMQAPAMRPLLSSIANNQQHPGGAPVPQYRMQTMQQHQQQFNYTNTVRNTPMPLGQRQQQRQQPAEVANNPQQQQQQPAEVASNPQQQHPAEVANNPQQQPAPAAAAGQEPLSPNMLATTGSQQQKEVLG